MNGFSLQAKLLAFAAVSIAVTGFGLASMQTKAGPQKPAIVASKQPAAKDDATTSNNKSRTAPKSDAERLQGIWLFESALQGKKNWFGVVWTSKLTVTGEAFQLPNFLDSKKDLTGKFNLDPVASSNLIDVKLDDFDLSCLELPLKFPAAAMPGIFKLDGEHLSICFNGEIGGKRPTDFDPRDDKMVRFTLVKAPPGFKEFPKEFSVKVTEPDGKPASGATLADFMNLMPDLEKKDVKPQWKYSPAIETGADGSAKVKFDQLHSSRLLTRNAEKKLMAIAAVSPTALLKSDLDIRLQPECKMTGTLVCDELKKLGRSIDHASVYLNHDSERIAYCDAAQGTFEFFVPSGTYTLFAYGPDVKHKTVTITVPPGKRELTVDPIALTVSKLVLQQGQPAPELDGVMGWKGKKVTLADLKGKYVLLEFWGFWCGPCVESMPVLIELHEKYADKGLAIIGVHLDVDGDIDTAAKLDDKIAGFRKDLWKGKDLPFPVALSSGKIIGEGDEKSHGGAAEQYGVSGYPTTILIDRDGKVVGKFNGRIAKAACAEIEKLLNEKK